MKGKLESSERQRLIEEGISGDTILYFYAYRIALISKCIL